MCLVRLQMLLFHLMFLLRGFLVSFIHTLLCMLYFTCTCTCAVMSHTTDFEVECLQGAVSGRVDITCRASNNISSSVCSFDGGAPEPCSPPLQLLHSQFGSEEHTLAITFTDEFNQTATIGVVFSVPAPLTPGELHSCTTMYATLVSCMYMYMYNISHHSI